MKRSHLLVIVGIAAALVACGKKAVRTPPVAVAPVTPAPAPPPRVQQPAAPTVDEYQRLKGLSADEIDSMSLLADIRFDFDRSDVRQEDRAVLAANADVLRRFDFLVIAVEGHCDERGTVEYNLALGERRARAAQDYLVSLGIPAARLKSVSYGKEAPLCREGNESCWAHNRRARFKVTGTSPGR